MKTVLLFILTAMMTVQSVGLSYVAQQKAVPLSPAGVVSGQQNADAMPCHSTNSQEIVSMDMSGCCEEQDCSCCWGGAGLMNVQLNIEPFHTPQSQPFAFNEQMLRMRSKSLYRPPIFA